MRSPLPTRRRSGSISSTTASLQGAPFVYGLTQARNPETLRMEFQTDETVRYPVRFWVEGDSYKLWGIFRNSRHLFGIGEPIYDASARGKRRGAFLHNIPARRR